MKSMRAVLNMILFPVIVVSFFLLFPFSLNAENVFIISGDGFIRAENNVTGNLDIRVKSGSQEGWVKYFHPQMMVLSKSISKVFIDGDTALIEGDAVVQGNHGFTFTVKITDGTPDIITMDILDSDGNEYFTIPSHQLVEGNFRIFTRNVSVANGERKPEDSGIKFHYQLNK